MQEIVAQVKRVASLIEEISGTATEQTRGIDQINQAITELDSVTQQNAALVEEAAAAADSLNREASRMVQVVSVFKLQAGDETADPASARYAASGVAHKAAAPNLRLTGS